MIYELNIFVLVSPNDAFDFLIKNLDLLLQIIDIRLIRFHLGFLSISEIIKLRSKVVKLTNQGRILNVLYHLSLYFIRNRNINLIRPINRNFHLNWPIHRIRSIYWNWSVYWDWSIDRYLFLDIHWDFDILYLWNLL
jgi:hypothetical protein